MEDFKITIPGYTINIGMGGGSNNAEYTENEKICKNLDLIKALFTEDKEVKKMEAIDIIKLIEDKREYYLDCLISDIARIENNFNSNKSYDEVKYVLEKCLIFEDIVKEAYRQKNDGYFEGLPWDHNETISKILVLEDLLKEIK